MKKLAFAVVTAATVAGATPLVAQEKPNDPFVSTALGGLLGLAVVGGVAAVVVIGASAANSSDGTK